MDPNFKFLDTCDFDTQRLIGALAAADESRETEMGCSDGEKQQGKRVIEVADDEVDSDVEETPPPIKPTPPCKQFSLESGSALGSGSFSTVSGSSSKAMEGKKNWLLLQYVEGGGVPSRLQKMERSKGQTRWSRKRRRKYMKRRLMWMTMLMRTLRMLL